MKIIKNQTIPFKGFAAINIFGILFVRKEYAERYEGTWQYEKMINHERIHWEQQKETLFILFYIWYGLEWLIRFLGCFDSHKAYKSISFEKEAYNNEENIKYVNERKRYNWIKLVKNQ